MRLSRALVFGLVAAPTLAVSLLARGLSALVAGRWPEASIVLQSKVPEAAAAPLAPPSTQPKKVLFVAEQAPSVDPRPVRCSFPSRVVVAVDGETSHRSIVVLDAFGGKRLMRVGDEVSGYRVLAIGAERTFLRAGRHTCFVDGQVPSAAVAPPAAVAGSVTGIALVDPTHARIDRAVRDKLLENHFELMRTLRAAPDLIDGKVVGLRLLNAPQGSVPAALGLRPGDSLRTINGFSLASPEQMLEAFAKLRTAPTLELQVMRGGAATTLTIEIH